MKFEIFKLFHRPNYFAMQGSKAEKPLVFLKHVIQVFYRTNQFKFHLGKLLKLSQFEIFQVVV